MALDTLRQRLDVELEKLRALCGGIPADVAGHPKIWDPYLGLVNLYEVVTVLRDHEEHHFYYMRLLLDDPPWTNTP